MSAANYDFSIEQGTSYRLTFIYKDSDGNAIDITNWCARLVMKTAYKDIAKKSLSSTIIYSSTNTDYSQYKFYIDGIEGKVTLLFPADTTNNFDFDTAKYDLELQSPDDFYTNGGNYTIRILYGLITIAKRNSGSAIVLDCQ
jgi:hypothetical protein